MGKTALIQRFVLLVTVIFLEASALPGSLGELGFLGLAADRAHPLAHLLSFQDLKARGRPLSL